MVYVNSQKFACASCIKGHRSSSCHHTDRPLFEIKKKGRPVSQCEKCRELRKNKRMHVKCKCVIPTLEGAAAPAQSRNASATPSMPRRPARREPPENPSLPNGLRDLWPTGSASQGVDANPRQRVDALLNPCNCKSVWKCKCSTRSERPFIKPASEADQDNTNISSPISPTVKSCCGGTVTTSADPPAQSKGTLVHGLKSPTPSAAAHREQRHLASMPYAHSSHASTSTSSQPMSPGHTPEALDNQLMCLDLPPLKLTSVTGSDLGALPSLRNFYDPTDNATTDEALRSLTRCGCGSSCACPGCKEHRGAEFAALSEEDCPDGCGSCVDHMGGLGLPSAFSVTLPSLASHSSSNGMHGRMNGHTKHHSTVMSSLDHFHAIAALVPPPPSSSRLGTLDPTNVTVYQPSSSNGVQKLDWQRAAGLVQVPPLNCCDGRCKCPGGMCGCGSECGGGCGRHGAGAGTVSSGKEMARAGEYISRESKENGGEGIGGACCAGKNAPGSAVPPSSKKVSRL